MGRGMNGGQCSRSHGALAGVEQVLESDELLVALDEVHAGLVVSHEDGGVGLEHGVQLVLQRLVVHREETHEVVQGRHVHVEELVLRVPVQDGQVLVHEQVLVELHVVQLHVVHETLQARVQRHDGVQEVRRPLLVEHRHETRPTHHRDAHHSRPAHGVRRQLTVLVDDVLQRTRHGLHRLVLGRGTDTGHGQTHVHRGTLTTGEELRVEVDLTVSDGDNVRHDVRRHVVRQGLHDRQSGERPTAHTGGHHRGTLQETRVQVEHVTRVRLTARGTTQQQRQLTVRHSLLRKIVVDDERVTPGVTELLADGHTGEGGEVLKTRGVGGRGGHDDGELQSVVQPEHTVDTSHVRATLTHRHVHRHDVVLTEGLLVDTHLVHDGRHGDGGLPGLTVTDDQLTLATADGDHRVHDLETSRQVVVHGLTLDDVRGRHVNLTDLRLLEEGAAALQRAGRDDVAKGVDHLTQDSETDGDLQKLLSGVHRLPGLHLVGVVEEDDTNAAVLVQVEHHGVRNTGLGVLARLDPDHTVECDTGAARRGHGGDGTVDGVNHPHQRRPLELSLSRHRVEPLLLGHGRRRLRDTPRGCCQPAACDDCDLSSTGDTTSGLHRYGLKGRTHKQRLHPGRSIKYRN
eukprot:Hpha_TRINITY_DN16398_c1_g2::TRINITY_DN16398_c1_g2_i6::g.62840::m.62840